MTEVFKADVRQALVQMQAAQQGLELAETVLKRALADLTSSEAATQAEAKYREEALNDVLDAVLASTGWRGLNRKRFKALITAKGRETPDEGYASVKHAVLHQGAQKVLGATR